MVHVHQRVFFFLFVFFTRRQSDIIQDSWCTFSSSYSPLMKYIWLNPVQQPSRPSHAVSSLRCVFQVRFLFGENDFVCVCVYVRPQCTFASRRSRRTRRCTRATRPSCTARPPATPSPTSTGRSRTSRWTSARTEGEETSLSLRW